MQPISAVNTDFVAILLGASLISWAAVLGLRAIGAGRLERGVCRFVEEAVEQRRQAGDGIDLSRRHVEETDFLGSETDRRMRARSLTGQVVNALYFEATMYRFDPVRPIIERIRPAVLARSTAMIGLQTLAVRLGILGTFIGLFTSVGLVKEVFQRRGTVIANTAAAGATADQLDSLQDRIAVLMGEIVQGLGLAFGTSIAGILAAIVIVGLAGAIRSFVEFKTLARIEAAAEVVQKYYRDASGTNEALIKSANELRSEMRRYAADLGDNRKELSRSIAVLDETASTMAHALSDPVRAFSASAGTLGAMITQIRSSISETAELHRQHSVFGAATDARLEAAIAGSVDAFQRSEALMQRSIEEGAQTIARAMGAISTEMRDEIASSLLKARADFGHALSTHVESQVLSQLVTRLDDGQRVLQETSVAMVSIHGRQSQRSVLIVGLAAAAMTAVSIGAIVLADRQDRLAPPPVPAATTPKGRGHDVR